jgi:hypothetical protein
MLDQRFEMLKKEVLDKKKLDEAMDWMREYVRRGADMSHAAAGEALAAAAVSVLWLSGNPADLSLILRNPRDGQVGREDFRYAFARHTLRLLIESYEVDDLPEYREDLDRRSLVEQVACLVKELAYQGGDLAESLGLQGSGF